MGTGNYKIKSDHDHGRSNPHPVHGAPFAGKQAPPFKKKAQMPIKKEDSSPSANDAPAQKEDNVG